MIEPGEQFIRLKERGHALTRLKMREEEFCFPLQVVADGARDLHQRARGLDIHHGCFKAERITGLCVKMESGGSHLGEHHATIEVDRICHQQPSGLGHAFNYQ